LGAFPDLPARTASQAIDATLCRLSELENPPAQWYARDALDRLADAAIVGLLYRLAESNGERYARLAELYARRFLIGEAYPDWALEDREVWLPLVEG